MTRHIFLLAGSLILATIQIAPASAQGFMDMIFGSEPEQAPNIAWETNLDEGLTDGNRSACVTGGAIGNGLKPGDSIDVHLPREAKISGIGLYLGKDGEVGSGDIYAKGYWFFSQVKSVDEHGIANDKSEISFDSSVNTTDLRFTLTAGGGEDQLLCITEFEVFGKLEPEGPEEEPVPNAGLEGNWHVTYFDADGVKGKIIKAWTSLKPSDVPGTWNSRGCRGPDYNMTCGEGPFEVPPSGRMEIHGGSFFMGHWGATSTVQQVGPDTIKGHWYYDDNVQGDEIWTRAHTKITHIEMDGKITPFGGQPARMVDRSSSYSIYGRMPGNQPWFGFQIYGENLWGPHEVYVDEPGRMEASGLELTGDYAGGWPPVIIQANAGPPSDVIGLGGQIYIWEDFTQGRHHLYVDGIEIPFDLYTPNYATDTEKPAVKFLVSDADGSTHEASEIAFGQTFIVEATYTTPQELLMQELTLDWTGEYLTLEMSRHNSDQVYRSEPVLLAPKEEIEG